MNYTNVHKVLFFARKEIRELKLMSLSGTSEREEINTKKKSEHLKKNFFFFLELSMHLQIYIPDT